MQALPMSTINWYYYDVFPVRSEFMGKIIQKCALTTNTSSYTEDGIDTNH